jgi:hypothetical protein
MKNFYYFISYNNISAGDFAPRYLESFICVEKQLTTREASNIKIIQNLGDNTLTLITCCDHLLNKNMQDKLARKKQTCRSPLSITAWLVLDVGCVEPLSRNPTLGK